VDAERDLRLFVDAVGQYFEAEERYYDHEAAKVIAFAKSGHDRLKTSGHDINCGEMVRVASDIVRDMGFAEDILSGACT
jgi:hypothetical protein